MKSHGKIKPGRPTLRRIFLLLICLRIIVVSPLSSQPERDLEEDLRYFQNQLEQQPNSPDINYNMAQVYFLMGKTDESIRFLERTIYLSPNDAEAHMRLASIYRKIGKLWNSRELLKKAVEIEPKNSDLWYELGVVLADLASYKEAIVAFQIALQYCETDEQKYRIIYYSGILHLTNRDYARYKEHLDRLKSSNTHYKDLKMLWDLANKKFQSGN